MCEASDKCDRTGNYWVLSRREIDHPGSEELNVAPFKSGVNVGACARHLATAVRDISAMNRDACTHVDGKDGIIVKVRRTGPNGDFWV